MKTIEAKCCDFVYTNVDIAKEMKIIIDSNIIQ
jgi:hypothetical protein